MNQPPLAQGLYDPANEHDACGVGFVAHIKGKKSPRHRRAGPADTEEPDASGRRGRRSAGGDGAGILLQMPDAFLREEMAQPGVKLPPSGEYGVGMVFLPREPASRLACEYEIERAIKEEGQVGARLARRARRQLGARRSVRKIEPVIRQVFIGRGARGHGDRCARAQAVRHPQELGPSRSRRWIWPTARSFTCRPCRRAPSSTRACCSRDQVGTYYKDLRDPRVVSALALVHQRFSTNTLPTWDLAHPFRLIAHNGEINTLRGNVNWMRARQGAISRPDARQGPRRRLWPMIYHGPVRLGVVRQRAGAAGNQRLLDRPRGDDDDSGGVGKPHADGANRRAFYEYHAAMMEPWDGPAAIAFTDGRQIGATLDRNGLRPARYIVTDDDLVIMGSECGCLPIPEERIVKKWRLQPGKMFLVDLEKGRIIDDKELKDTLANAQALWRVDRAHPRQARRVESDRQSPERSSACALLDRQQAFAYTQEESSS